MSHHDTVVGHAEVGADRRVRSFSAVGRSVLSRCHFQVSDLLFLAVETCHIPPTRLVTPAGLVLILRTATLVVAAIKMISVLGIDDDGGHVRRGLALVILLQRIPLPIDKLEYL